jgi:hypothetical protein
MTAYRTRVFSSLVIFPVVNALGHLAPAIGASWAAAGRPIWDVGVLVLLLCVHILLDSGYFRIGSSLIVELADDTCRL